MNKKILPILMICLTSFSLTSCASKEDHEEHSISSTQAIEKPEIEPLENIENDEDNSDTVESTEITAEKELIDKADKVSIADKNRWFFEQMRNVKVDRSEDELLGMRSDICLKLDKGESLESISESLSLDGLNEEQQGVLIGSSMVSQCPDASAMAKKGNVVNKKDKMSDRK